MKSETMSDKEWMPPAIKPGDFEPIPTPTWVDASNTLTATLTHVLREAATARWAKASSAYS
jgi:hypothetical protein